jgi:bifunctional non-homologous end joining protein LigD
MLYAFDMLAGDGEDLRPWPLALRKGALAGLLSDPVDGIFIAEYEQGKIGDVLFRVACNMGGPRGHCLEASRSWLLRRPVQTLDQSDPTHPAYSRVRDALATRSRISCAG